MAAVKLADFLKRHEAKSLLRFITCGSVDDGKSTLIGRMLHDTQQILEDQLAAVTNDSRKWGTTGNEVDLALLVDGLQAEREQGITIDVAYRYFDTEKRKYIIADCPGHEQYTRNMATGASTCDLAIILIDAARGVQVQTRRHSYLVSLLGIRHIIVAVNKMDLVNYDEKVFRRIHDECLADPGHQGRGRAHRPRLRAEGRQRRDRGLRHALVQGTGDHGDPGHDRRQPRPGTPGPAHAGAVREPAGPHVPRLLGHDRGRQRRSRRSGHGRALAPHEQGARDHHLRRQSGRRRRRAWP